MTIGTDYAEVLAVSFKEGEHSDSIMMLVYLGAQVIMDTHCSKETVVGITSAELCQIHARLHYLWLCVAIHISGRNNRVNGIDGLNGYCSYVLRAWPPHGHWEKHIARPTDLLEASI